MFPLLQFKLLNLKLVISHVNLKIFQEQKDEIKIPPVFGKTQNSVQLMLQGVTCAGEWDTGSAPYRAGGVTRDRAQEKNLHQ